MSRVSDGVVLLDGFDVKSLELHHGLNVTFEGVELTKPNSKRKRLNIHIKYRKSEQIRKSNATF